MPEPTPRRPRRRINPDKAPFDTLPVIKADRREGPIRVIRGDLDLDGLTDEQRDDVQLMYGHDFVVFTNSFGQHRLAWRGQLIDPDLDLSRMGDLPRPEELGDEPDDPLPYSIATGASVLRDRARRLLDLAELYQQLVDTGWELHDDPLLAPYGNIVNRSTEGKSFAPGRR